MPLANDQGQWCHLFLSIVAKWLAPVIDDFVIIIIEVTIIYGVYEVRNKRVRHSSRETLPRWKCARLCIATVSFVALALL